MYVCMHTAYIFVCIYSYLWLYTSLAPSA